MTIMTAVATAAIDGEERQGRTQPEEASILLRSKGDDGISVAVLVKGSIPSNGILG